MRIVAVRSAAAARERPHSCAPGPGLGLALVDDLERRDDARVGITGPD
jgi:hypothetical protein